MNWCQALDSLDLNNDRILNQQIKAIAAVQLDFTIQQRQRFLLLNLEPALSQLEG